MSQSISIRALFSHLLLFAVLVAAAPGTAGPITGPYVPGEIIIKYADTATSGEISDLASQLKLSRVRDFSRIRASLERLTDTTVAEAIALLENHPLVEYVEPNYVYTIEAVPNDPDFPMLWGMNNTGQTGGTPDADIDAPEAWNQFTGSQDVVVGVIDTGVDYNHPDLAANIWTNPGEIPGNGIDDDNNGFVDDIHGWDFVNNDNNPMDDHGHGTHCSGTIGGVGNNAVGVAGVNWNVRIMALKFLGSGGSGSTADAIGCVEYATAMGARLTSNSWGGGAYSTALEAAIEDAHAAGILFVAAAGNAGTDNDFSPHYPSSYTTANIVAVGATDPDDNRVVTGSWASCYGATSVDIGAPGLDIYSTLPSGGYGYKSGTSMATPHVSGVLALVAGQYPDITADAAKALILNSADVLPQLAGLWVSGARLNAAKALSGPDSIPPYPVTDLEVVEAASNRLALAWTATGDDGDVGIAAAYDIRYATFPIDGTNFDTATIVDGAPAPAAPGQPDTVTIAGLDFLTTYHVALRVKDEYGNTSPVSNVATGTTLGIPVVSASPASLAASLITGERQDQILTIGNTGAGTLDFTLTTVRSDSAALAMQVAAAAVVAGIAPGGTATADAETFPVLTQDEVSLLRGRLATYAQASSGLGAEALPVIGVGGYWSTDMMYMLLGNAELAALFTFREVDYEYGDLADLDGLVVAEMDYAISDAGAAALRGFFDSGRPILMGMDDFDSNWIGPVPGLLGPVFGITNPSDAELCANATLNTAHPICEGIPAFVIGGAWCNDNDRFQLDGADWLVRDGTQGNIFGVANDASARTVLFGENLAAIWDANVQLNVNAVIWMMEQGGLPTVSPASGSVPAGGSMDITVTFDADGLCGGDYLADIVVASNDPVAPEVRVPADMHVTGEPDIGVSDTVLDYGPVFVGAVVTDTLVVSNPGCDVVHVTAVATDFPDFQADLTPFDLLVGERRLLVISYAPAAVGPAAGTLSLSSNDPDQPLLTVALNGTGVEAPVIGVSPALLAADLLTGEVETQFLTISNTGGSDLVFDVATESADALAAGARVSSGRLLNPGDGPDKAGADATGEGAWTEGSPPRRDPLPVPAQTVPGTSATDLSLVIVCVGAPSEIQAQLLAFSDIAVVDIFDASFATPSLADLADYNAVILANGNSFPDPVGLGNVLADFVDQGGGVVQTIASFVGGFDLAGRFVDEGYSAFGLGSGPIGYGSLAAFDADHPIMAGVTAVWGDALATAPLAVGAQWVADWSIGEAFVATQGSRVVGVNIYVAYPGYWMDDLPLVLHNAAAWVSRGSRWLGVDPTEGVVQPGGSVDLLVTFDASGVCGGTYPANILIDSNDPLAPRTTVPAELTVTGEPDIAVSDTALAYGRRFVGAVVPDTVIVANPGCDLLQVTGIAVDHADFGLDTTPFDLMAGESRILEVVYSPTSLGPATGSLSLTSNDPDRPVVTVALTGEGVESPVLGVSPSRLAADLLTGEVETQMLTISNTGGNDLVWEVGTVRRDSLAVALQAAAAAVVAGITPSGEIQTDDATMTVLAEQERVALADRMTAYRQAVADLGAEDAVPLIGVGGGYGYDLLYWLLANPELTGEYTFMWVDYVYGDLSALSGLMVAENDAAISETGAASLRAFYDGGRAVFLGMDDFDNIWYGAIPSLLGPMFGVANPVDANLCNNAVLNTAHPINDGIPGFTIGGYWCNDNDRFELDGAEWLFMDGSQGNIFGAAQSGTARTVVMGENLAGIWLANEQLNISALAWLMGGGNLPQVDPVAGVVPSGGTQDVAVTFDATKICGGTFLADLVVTSNDPLAPRMVVPADMTVTGVPDIDVSDTAVAFGPVFVGASAADTVVVSNPGCGVLRVRPYMAILIQEAGFWIDTTHFDLQPGQSRELVVRYTPTGIGAVAGEFTLASEDPDESAFRVGLSGAGIEPPVIGVSPAALTAELVTGEIRTEVLTISNAGGNDLEWEIEAVRRDSVAVVLQEAAAAVVAGITPSGTMQVDGGILPVLADDERALLSDRLSVYAQTVTGLAVADAVPLIGVGGYFGYDLLYLLLGNPVLTGEYTFTWVNYVAGDLAALDGLVVSEYDANIYEPEATALRAFHDSGRPVFLGMDDFDSIWYGSVPSLLGPMFGIANPVDADLCSNAVLNTAHPVNEGIPGFFIGGYWCGDNDRFQLDGADWLFMDGGQGNIFGAARSGRARTVVMGETLFGIWQANEQLNVNALVWAMGGAGVPQVDPIAGVVPAGGTQDVAVTFDATDLCGGTYLSNLMVTGNDPLAPLTVVPADMTVTGVPDIDVSDTTVVFSPLFVGATATDTVVVANKGCDVLFVRPYMAVEIREAGFSIDTTHFELQAGGSRDLVVTYAPTGVGAVTGEFTLASEDPDESAVRVSLSGEGIEPPVIGLFPARLDADLVTGGIETQMLAISNTGGNDLVWEIAAVRSDSLASAVRAAAGAAVAGINPSGTLEVDGATLRILSEQEQALLADRMTTYRQTVASVGAEGALPLIGVGGYFGYDLLALLLADPQLSGMYIFTWVNYVVGDLSTLNGLIVSEADGNMYQTGATAIRAFHDSGRPVFLGMDDLDDAWTGYVPALLAPVFGIAYPQDGNLCGNAILNTAHPINEGIPGFVVGGAWCLDDDSFVTTTADWLFREGSTGQAFGVAHEGAAHAVLMGENLAGIWSANAQLNANAIHWMMGSAGLPQVDPASGVVPPGGTQDVAVTFDATGVCSGTYPAVLVVSNNDPLAPRTVVPADMTVTGVPDIGVSDTAVAFGPVYVGFAATDTVVISNEGCDVLFVRPYMAIAIREAGFSIDTTHFELQAGESRALAVSYAPTAAGVVTGEFTLASDDPDESAVRVFLSGEGVEPPVIGVSPAELTAELMAGETENRILTIGNSGGTDLVFGVSIEDLTPQLGAARVSRGQVLGGKTPETPAKAATGGDAWTMNAAPLREPLPTPTITRPGTNAFDLAVLIVGAGYLTEIRDQLLAFSDIAVVDIFDAGSGTPSLAVLGGYHAVILANGYTFFDPNALGNVLADYVDQGGGVIQTVASFVSGWQVGGRFMNGGYSAFGLGTGPFGFSTLGQFDASHPIMAGVTSLWGDVLPNAPLAAGAQWVADWTVGYPFVATQGDRVAGVNIYVAEPGFWAGDVPLVLHNAAVWVSGATDWLAVDPTAGAVAPGGTVDLLVTFDAADATPGYYDALLHVGSNDPATPLVSVPAGLAVLGTLMTVDVAVTAGAAADPDNTLGFGVGASDGYDGLFDLPEQPPAPANFVSGYFDHPEWNSPVGDRFMTDIRAPYDPGTVLQGWPFVVETDVADTTTLVFNPSFDESGGWQLWIRNESTGDLQYLFPSLTYSFAPAPGANVFTILVGKLVPPLDPPERPLAAGWSLLGVPLVPPAGGDTWADVLLDDVTGTAYLFDYAGPSGYRDVAGNDPVVQGRGVWLAATDAAVWTMTGDPDDGAIDVASLSGWNLVGYPLWIPGGLDGVVVEHGGQILPWSAAVAAGLVSPFVYDYDGSTDTYIPVASLQPWRGYWMAAHTTGVTMRFDYRSMLSVAPVEGGVQERLPRLVEAGAGWQLEVGLAQGAADVAIGMTPGATTGFDAAFDLPVPPDSPLGAEKATLVIRHPEWNLACGSAFYSDLVDVSTAPRAWSLTVQAPQPGAVTLQWDPAYLPAEVDLQVYLPHENRVVVASVRAQTSVRVDVGSMPLEVQFRTAGSVADVPGQLAGLQLRNVPNPFNPLTEFRFNLPRSGDAEIRIFDVRGAVVRRVRGGVMSGGPGVLRWAGHDDRGRDVASGVYFYRLYLDGSQEGPTIKMTLLK